MMTELKNPFPNSTMEDINMHVEYSREQEAPSYAVLRMFILNT